MTRDQVLQKIKARLEEEFGDRLEGVVLYGSQARDYWERALQAVKTAKQLKSEDPDAAANRAYYAAFYDEDGNIVGMEILDASKKIENPSAIEYAVV